MTCGLVRTEAEKDALLRYAELLEGGMRPDNAGVPLFERPPIAVSLGLPRPEETQVWFDCSRFDCILAREPWRGGEAAPAFADFAAAARTLLAPGGTVVTLQSPPPLGQRLSAFLATDIGAAAGADTDTADSELSGLLAAAEEAFFTGDTEPARARWTWTAAALEAAFSGAGLSVTTAMLERTEARVIGAGDIAGWFDAERSPWGAFVRDRLGEKSFDLVRTRITEKAKEGPLCWSWKTILLCGRAL